MQWRRWVLVCLMGVGMCYMAVAQKTLQGGKPQRVVPQELKLDTVKPAFREVATQQPLLKEHDPRKLEAPTKLVAPTQSA